MMPMFDLSGRVALVTGGNKGLGRAMAEGLAAAGANVILAGRSPELLRTAAAEMAATHKTRIGFVVGDIGDRAAIKRMADEAIAQFGRVDILINNAGINIRQPIDAVTDEAWDQVLAVNLTGCMALTRAVVPGMVSQKWGRIIHISSIFGTVSREKRSAYSATKAALMGMTKSMAVDLGPSNVTVNCIAPGPFLTDMPMSALTDAEKQSFADHTCLGRWGNPAELAGPAVFLASEAGSFVTGQLLVVDGGYTAR